MTSPARFDPLVDLDGLWTHRLAERYLPIAGVAADKYECVDGKLILTPYEGTANGYAMLRLADAMYRSASAAGLHVYPAVNVLFEPQRWVQPDLVALNRSARGLTWLPAEYVVMMVELGSPTSRRKDRCDKPTLCARHGIPYYLDVEITYEHQHAEATLFSLDDGRYVTIARDDAHGAGTPAVLMPHTNAAPNNREL